MPTNSNASTVASEIDAIIAKAMQEYQAAHGVEVFPETTEDSAIRDEMTVVSAGNLSDGDLQEIADQLVAQVTAEPEHVDGEIPENSGSLLVDETTSRFSSAEWYNKVQQKVVTLAGVGGIGSYVAFLLGRLHIASMYIYDDDTVEAGNMSGQLYCTGDIGHRKVDAINSMLYGYAGYYDANTYAERFIADSPASDIMICGFDNMEARKTYYNAWKRWVEQLLPEYRQSCLFIDGRLAAEELQVFCIKGDDDYNMRRYEEEFLFADSEAEETICSYKQTTFIANMIGSIICNLFVNFCANECNPLVPRDLPFLTQYNASTMFFKVTN